MMKVDSVFCSRMALQKALCSRQATLRALEDCSDIQFSLDQGGYSPPREEKLHGKALRTSQSIEKSFGHYTRNVTRLTN